MNYVKLLIATLGGTVTNFLCGWIIYGMLFRDSMGSGMTDAAKATIMPIEQHHIYFYALGSLVFALMLAYIYESWTSIRTFVPGATAGGIITLLFSLNYDFNFLAGMNWYSSTSPIFMNALLSGVIGAITGGVVALLLGWKRS